MRREEYVLCQTCGELVSVQNLLIDCRMHTKPKRDLEIQDNLYETLGPNENYSKKLLLFRVNVLIRIILFKNHFTLMCTN